MATPFWERTAGPVWWCHLSAELDFVKEWLGNAQWLHPAVSLALRDESKLISERMKHLLYEESYLLRNLKDVCGDIDLDSDNGGARVSGRGNNHHGKERNKGFFIVDIKKGRMRIRMKVALAPGVVLVCIDVGVGVMHYVEELSWLDSLYLSVMSVTTVGYGDRACRSMHGRIFASIWLLVSTLAVARAFL